jgi:para-aminobenzoate synthetase component 1
MADAQRQNYLAAALEPRRVYRKARGSLDLLALIPALGLRAGVDPFVLLDGQGWGGSVLAFDPERTLNVKDESPFKRLRNLLAGEPGLTHPLEGGPALFGYLSYDAVRYLEQLPSLARDDLGLPTAQFILPRYTITLAEDEARVSVLADEDPTHVLRALGRAESLQESLPAPCRTVPRSGLGREGYMKAVEQVKEYVRAGDVFQVNISQRLEAPFGGDPLSLYATLKEINPSPYGGVLSFPGFVAISSSPERLVRLSGRHASTRPIAGTYPGGSRSGRELLLDPKERAEHVMIVDLERNDLGRTAAYGTVRVEELMSIERYSHVVHIVSEIVGELAPGRDAVDLLSSMFPGGSITGCPKVRCMEIIEEIEPVRRGLYTGSFGYIGLGGDAMDMNIIIRTILLKDGVAYAQAGGGVVVDSDPEREYRESLSKAAALLESLGVASP